MTARLFTEVVPSLLLRKYVRSRLKNDIVTKSFQPPDQDVGDVPLAKTVEIIGSEFAVVYVALQHVVCHHQKGMSHGNDRSFPTSSCGQTMVKRGKVVLLQACNCPRSLAEATTQTVTAFARLPSEPLARALMVAWT